MCKARGRLFWVLFWFLPDLQGNIFIFYTKLASQCFYSHFEDGGIKLKRRRELLKTASLVVQSVLSHCVPSPPKEECHSGERKLYAGTQRKAQTLD